MTITASQLYAITGVRFGSAAASFKVESQSAITAIVPPGSAGPVMVAVSNVAGEALKKLKFTYKNPKNREQQHRPRRWAPARRGASAALAVKLTA